MNEQDNHQELAGEQTCEVFRNPAGLRLTPAALLESLLFVASGPTPVGRLAAALELTPAAVTAHLHQLEQAYQARGLRLLWVGDSVQMTSAPMAAPVVERFLGLEVTSRLSPAALEVLAIVAYRQPATRPQIEQIRGVNSDASLRTLLSKGLIEEVGRVETAGRPILYGTTPEFLRHFGLTSLADLPPLDVEQSLDVGQSAGLPGVG
ncbi:MAG: SMC-Scp complex subunit ScpB [Chloroflexota bacterium]